MDTVLKMPSVLLHAVFIQGGVKCGYVPLHKAVQQNVCNQNIIVMSGILYRCSETMDLSLAQIMQIASIGTVFFKHNIKI